MMSVTHIILLISYKLISQKMDLSFLTEIRELKIKKKLKQIILLLIKYKTNVFLFLKFDRHNLPIAVRLFGHLATLHLFLIW